MIKQYAEIAMCAVGIVLLLVATALIERHGYNRGVLERNAYYEPILRQAAEAKISADQRASAAEKRADTINNNLETEHEQAEQALLERATSAESRIASLLRQHSATAPHCGEQVPPVPGAPARGDGQGPGVNGDDRLAGGVSTVGKHCEHDADSLTRWQEWYSQQRESLKQLSAETP